MRRQQNTEETVEAPRGVEFRTRPEAPVKAVNERTRVLGYGMVALVFGCFLWGVYYRARDQRQMKQERQEKSVAGGPATSSRGETEKGSANDAYNNRGHWVKDANGNPHWVKDSDVANNNETHPTVAFRPNGQVQPPAVASGLTPQEQALATFEAAQLKDEIDAREAGINQARAVGAAAPTAVPQSSNTMPQFGSSLQVPTAPVPDYAAVVNAIRGSGNGGMAFSEGSYSAQNDQAGKRAFQQDPDKASYLLGSRQDPITEFELMQGTYIPATLESHLDTDLPGKVTLTVSQDMHDSKTGKYVEIPAGTKAECEYNSNVGYAQSRVQVVCTRFIFRDTTAMDIGKAPVYSIDGSSGVHDKTNNHYGRLIQGLAITSALSAGLAISQNHTQTLGTLSYPSTGSLIGASVGQNANTIGQQLTEQNLRIQPENAARAGKEVMIRVSKDLVFQGPYVDR